MPRHAVVIRNPAARRAVPVERLVEAARRSAPSWDVAVWETASAADAPDLAERAAREGAEAVLACGGDGTLNGVINGLRRPGCPDLVAGLVPAGTANVWAREAAIPFDPARALGLLETGREVRVDLGVATVGGVQRRFLLMCGVGLDAAVVEAVERSPRLKRRLAQGAFLVAGARAPWSEQPVLAVVEVDGESTRRAVVLAVAGNTRLY
ncbi:MAG: diacylglycerol kinase family protein, partial [Dehalococcoidia bacterium]